MCPTLAGRPSVCTPSPPPLTSYVQFSSSKWLPGGKQGATELAQALDLGEALMLLHLDLESLQASAVPILVYLCRPSRAALPSQQN